MRICFLVALLLCSLSVGCQGSPSAAVEEPDFEKVALETAPTLESTETMIKFLGRTRS